MKTVVQSKKIAANAMAAKPIIIMLMMTGIIQNASNQY
jgi:hypothetical protein